MVLVYSRKSQLAKDKNNTHIYPLNKNYRIQDRGTVPSTLYTQQGLFYFYLTECDKCLFIFLRTYNTVYYSETLRSVIVNSILSSIIAEKFATQLCKK